MTKLALLLAAVFVVALVGCAKKAEVSQASPPPEAAATAGTESAMPASPGEAESAAPASSSAQAGGTVKLTGALTVSYSFSPTCAIRGADVQKMGLAPGYILDMGHAGNINSGTVIVTDYTKDGTYDETSRVLSTPGQGMAWSPLDLNFALKPGASQDVLTSAKDSSLKVTIGNSGTTGSATFANFNVREGRVSGSVDWTCTAVQR